MLKLPTLYGQKVILREVKESDIDDRVKIGRHNEFVHMCGGNSLSCQEFPDRKVWENWFSKQKEESCAFVIEFENRCIGTARFHHISKEDRCATYAIGIFDTTLHSKGIGTEVTMMMLEYGFISLGFHRIELKVLDYNKRAIRCYEKCGFNVDGILRENAFIDGKFHSDIVMSILENEYQEAQTEKE